MTKVDQEPRWWFSVRFSPDGAVCVERFETKEQAELYAAATGGFVPFTVGQHGTTDNIIERLYSKYFFLSERTK